MSNELETLARRRADELAAEAVLAPPLPIARYVSYLMAAARYWDDYSAPLPGKHPGLVVFAAFFGGNSSAVLRTLAELIAAEQSASILPASPKKPDPAVLEAGQFHDGELDACISAVLDDGVEEDLDRSYALAKSRGAGDSSSWSLAQSLNDKAAIAEALLPRLQQLPDFDPKLLGTARELAKKLSASAPSSGPAASEAIVRRNRLITVAEQGIDVLERAARYAFRAAPEVLDRMPTRAAFERRGRKQSPSQDRSGLSRRS